jgi:hypothetical protein
MFRARRSWAALVCFTTWAFGPAIGIGLAAHELEHHGPASPDHSHAAQAVEALLHGHFHEDEADDHHHQLAQPSPTPSRVGHPGRNVSAALHQAGALSRTEIFVLSTDSTHDPTLLIPPDLFGLCVQLL